MLFAAGPAVPDHPAVNSGLVSSLSLATEIHYQKKEILEDSFERMKRKRVRQRHKNKVFLMNQKAERYREKACFENTAASCCALNLQPGLIRLTWKNH